MLINGLIIILLCQFAGELLAYGLGLPIPGTIIGMVLLLLGLMLSQPCRQQVEPAVSVLIRHLTLLFFPIGAGLVLEWPTFAQHGSAIIIALTLGTLATIVIVAVGFNRLLNLRQHD